MHIDESNVWALCLLSLASCFTSFASDISTRYYISLFKDCDQHRNPNNIDSNYPVWRLTMTLYDTRSLLFEPILVLFESPQSYKASRLQTLPWKVPEGGINYMIRSFDVIKIFGTKSHHIYMFFLI